MGSTYHRQKRERHSMAEVEGAYSSVCKRDPDMWGESCSEKESAQSTQQKDGVRSKGGGRKGV